MQIFLNSPLGEGQPTFADFFEWPFRRGAANICRFFLNGPLEEGWPMFSDFLNGPLGKGQPTFASHMWIIKTRQSTCDLLRLSLFSGLFLLFLGFVIIN